MLQDELNSQTAQVAKTGVRFTVKAGELTLKLLAKIILNHVEKKYYTGEQSIKNLIKSGQSLEAIDLNGKLKPFTDYAKKAGIDFSVLKDGKSNPPTWNIFFKGKDRAIIEKFMEGFAKDWQAGKVEPFNKTSIVEKLNKFREDIKKQKANMDKVKHHKQERAER